MSLSADGVLEPASDRAFRGGLFGPWPFEPSAIRTPVIFFHGERDHTVSVAAARALASHVPDAHLRIWQQHGHFSLLPYEAHNVLADLARQHPGCRP